MDSRRKNQDTYGSTANSKDSINSRNNQPINKKENRSKDEYSFRASAATSRRDGGGGTAGRGVGGGVGLGGGGGVGGVGEGAPLATDVRCRLSSDSEKDFDDVISADEDGLQFSRRRQTNCRSRTLRLLETDSLQVALYLLVVLDAIVVIAEILLDLHALRSQYGEATSDLKEAMDFLKDVYPMEELDECKKDNVRFILDALRQKQMLFVNDSSKNPRNPPPQSSFYSQQMIPFPNEGTPADNEIKRANVNSNDDGELLKFENINNEIFNDHRPKSGEWDSSKFKSRSNGEPVARRKSKRDSGGSSEAENGDGRGGGGIAGALKTSTCSKTSSYVERLLKIAHLFHYVGVGILSFFVIQVSLKIFGMGSEFFKKKLEIFDAVIVMTSFGLDLLFVFEGIDVTGEEAIALLIIFLLWRILRIINGIMVTAKKRHEFRIQLLKRGRKRTQKRIEYLEDDKTWKEREIANLRVLCSEHGATEDEITLCRPGRRTFLRRLDTSLGLSAIASLSLGISMSMTESGRAVIESLSATELRRPTATTTTPGGGAPRRRCSWQQTLGGGGGGATLGPPPDTSASASSSYSARRPSFVAILQQMSEQNRLLELSEPNVGPSVGGRPPPPLTRPARVMDRVPKELTEGKREGGKGAVVNDGRMEDVVSKKDKTMNGCENGEESGHHHEASRLHRADKKSTPDVVIHEPLLSKSPSTSRSSTKDIPVQGPRGGRKEGASIVSSAAEEPESFCNSDLPPPTSSSLPQLSAAPRRRCNLSLGCLAGRVPRPWKRSQNNGRCGRDSRWSSLTVVTRTVDGQTPAEDEQKVASKNMQIGEKKPSGSFSGTRLDRTTASTATSEVVERKQPVALGCRRSLEFRGHGQGQGQGQASRTVNKKRLLQVGVAWSRSQEFQPRKFHHDVLGFSKLVTRRKSYHCVYSENVGGSENGPHFL